LFLFDGVLGIFSYLLAIVTGINNFMQFPPHFCILLAHGFKIRENTSEILFPKMPQKKNRSVAP